MINITIESINKLNPCPSGIEPFEKNHPNYNGSLSKLLAFDDVPYNDKIWLASRVVDYKVLQQWSVECAENVVDNYNSLYPEDTRISDCIQKTKDYLNGQCSKEELLAAESAAESAARSAESAAWSAARSAWSAAWSAAESARSAAWSAAEAAWSAAESAWSAESAEKHQEDINISILIALLENL